jgi:hypothetical protein
MCVMLQALIRFSPCLSEIYFKIHITRNRVLLEKLTVKEFPACYGIEWFIGMCTAYSV